MEHLITDGKKKKRKVNRLLDMVVSDVDLVDRPANGRKFVLFKREAEMPGKNTDTQGDGEVVDLQVSDAEANVGDPGTDGETSPPPTSDSETQPKSDETTEDKKNEKPEEVKKEEGETEEAPAEEKEKEGEEATAETDVESDVEKVMMVCPKCGEKAEAKEGEEMKCPKCEEPMVAKAEEDEEFGLSKSAQEAMLSTLNEAVDRLESLGTVIRTSKAVEQESSTPLPNTIHREFKSLESFVSNLANQFPEAATKAEGDDGGAAIHDLLKQAEVSIPGPVREMVISKVRSAIERLLSVSRDVRAMKATDEQTKTPLPKNLSEAIKGVATDLATIVEKYPSPASKSDSMMAELRANCEKLRESFDGIQNSIAEIMVSATGVKKEDLFPTKKNEEERKTEERSETEKRLEDKVEALTEQVSGLVKSLAKPEEDGKGTEEQSPAPASNAVDTDEVSTVGKSENIGWPSDLTEGFDEKK